MEWIKTILPLLGVVLGWVLSEKGKLFADKRQDTRKLKKLLFFLLELRFHFYKELNMELVLDKYTVILSNKIADKLGLDRDDPEFKKGIASWRPALIELISKNKTPDDKYIYLSENIDKILIELAEIYPILAYELNGQHNIKDRLNNASKYFSDLQSTVEQAPFDIQQWMNPKLTQDLLNDLDESIRRIAIQVDKLALKLSNEKISGMVFENNQEEIDILIDEYMEKVQEILPKE
jgi:hypothetical protein